MNGGPLPADVNAALAALAAQYPEVLQFDEKRGMIRFAADFTFDPGSVGLKASALSVLSQLATILNSNAANPFEVVVVGHTDNVPIKSPRLKIQATCICRLIEQLRCETLFIKMAFKHRASSLLVMANSVQRFQMVQMAQLKTAALMSI